MTKLLIVEDDLTIITALSLFLNNEGFQTVTAKNQREALEKLNEPFDLALIDITLPDGNGYEVCRAIKQNGDTPVIFLTARGDEYSVVTGLDLGGDDYIEKPYRPMELLSRINSVLRRCGKKQSQFIIGDLTVDTVKGNVCKAGKDVFLSALEYRILLVFLANPDTVMTRSRLLNDIWDWGGEFVDDNTLTVYIKRLRKKIEDDPQNPRMIETVRGIGYRLGRE